MNFNIELYDRDGKLYVKYYQFGKLKRKSLKLTFTKINLSYAKKNIVPTILEKLIKGEEVDRKKVTISHYIDIVLENSLELKPSTQRLYKIGAKYTLDYFKNFDVRDIKVSDIESYIKTLKNTLTAKSIKLYLVPLNLALKQAMKDDIIFKNPFEFATKPKVIKKEVKVFNIFEIETILNNSVGKLQTFIYIAFFSGMRRCEIIGLKWEDIDFDRGLISINRCIKEGFIGSPKSGKNRVIPLMNILREHLITKRFGKYGFIFTKGKTKEPFKDGQTYLTLFRKLLVKLNYEHRGLHDIRHTFTSLMIQAGENITLIQKFLGHESLTMINEIYAHHIEDKNDTVNYQKLLNFDTKINLKPENNLFKVV